ncbi:MAG TPA: hypothetical protein DDY98_02365, partial [Ruminococcaceae bacterium]|nr:hypothetical protein [Oscillospiraceae bacterium]
MSREYTRLNITPKAERSVRAGHPWVYGEEVTAVSGEYRNGDIVDVYSSKDKWLGAGFVNDRSKIRVRILSRNTNDRFDEAFFVRRVKYALAYRKDVMGDDFSCCRLIFGEADGFPGLTVDRFEDILVTEVLCLGTEQRKDWIYRALVETMQTEYAVTIRSIYERNEAGIRLKEGLETGKGFVNGFGLRTDLDGHVEITENSIRYDVDYIKGQKTGFFLDQKYNRL